MLLGSISKNLEEVVAPPVEKPFVLFVAVLKGTPSTTNRGWLEPVAEE
jgi:hypothetical protein